MAISPVDKSDEFKSSGMKLITELSSEPLLRKSRKNKHYSIPEDRLERQCGGKNGFDDFVERFDEWT